MKLGRWVCCSLLLLLAACAWAQVREPAAADVLASAQQQPPAVDDPRWQPAAPGRPVPGAAAWYRVSFDAPAGATFWSLYLPYLYGGGRVWLNGTPVADVAQNSPTLRVRWERPLLLPLPPAALQPGPNVLLLRAAADDVAFGTILPPLELGPEHELQPHFDRRLLVVRTVPVVTVVTGVVVGALVLLIWWRRRDEQLYGLFGLAALLWAVRTATFAFDTATPAVWDAWRLVYFISTGGFVIVLALFALALAGWSRRWLTRVLLAYWALGPLVYLLGGEGPAAGVWVAGLVPVGLVVVAVVFGSAWRRRSGMAVAIAIALGLAALAGLHDYLLATKSPALRAALPEWSAARLFLLHHAANLLLAVMGVQLALRFIGALDGLETANRTLEVRVQEREREIAASYERIATLQREQAATDERQRIMRDLHDGLGSQLFTSLSRAERGNLDSTAMADTLRGAIDQMRVAIEALASDEQDFRTTFGNFRFRWDARLREAGLATDWQVDGPDEALTLAPHDGLQILHIVQEALTNVLKHAQARHVSVRLLRHETTLQVVVTDDGRGLAPDRRAGRGHANMRTRAQRLGAALEVTALPQGTLVSLTLPR